MDRDTMFKHRLADDGLLRALHPAGKEFMRMRWLSPGLNQHERYGIRVAALIPFGFGFAHIKAIPAFQMMLEDYLEGRYDGVHTLVVPSSGNTVQAVARLARSFGIHVVKAVMTTDVPDSKTGPLKAMRGVEVMQVKNVSATALKEAGSPGHLLLDQYSHPGNVRAHELYTAPEIIRLLGPTQIGAIAIALGSAATADGVSRELKRHNRNITVVGARPRLGEAVPGARDEAKMAEVVKFDWQSSVDHIEEVSRRESFLRMRRLWDDVDPQPGPTGGMAWAALDRYLTSLSVTGREMFFREGKVAAFVCADDGRFYSERITGELDPV